MNYQLLTFVTIILLLGCASPKKSFEKGNYEQAYKSSLKKVKSKKATRQDKEILYESLRNIISQNMDEINSLEQSNNPKELEKALKLVGKTQKKVTEAKRYTSLKFDENLLELDDKEAELTQILFDHYFDSGLFRLKTGERNNDKFLIQDAYHDFRKAIKYQESEKLDSLQAVALELGVIYINVDASATFDIGSDWEIDRTFEDVESRSNKFLEVTYSSFPKDVDCEIAVRFRDLEVLLDDEITEQNDYEQRVIVDYETVSDTTGTREEPIYGTVYGSVLVRLYRKIAVADVDIDIRSNSNNCQLRETSFSRTLEAEVEDITVSGDERAIPNEYRGGSSGSINDLPDDDDLLEELIEEVYEEFVREYF